MKAAFFGYTQEDNHFEGKIMTTTTQMSVSESESIRSRITKVEGFKTTDNKVHESEAAAVQHQAMLVRKEKLSQFCSTHFYRDIGTDDIADILEKEREALLIILAGG